MSRHRRWHDEPLGCCDACGGPVYAWDAEPFLLRAVPSTITHAACYAADYDAVTEWRLTHREPEQTPNPERTVTWQSQ